MAWLRDWKRRRVLARHRIDDALWRRALRHLPFLHGLSADEQRRLKELAVVFLAEKQLTPVRGLALSEDDRVEIALQACLPILELGLDWYDGWVGIVVHPSDFRVQRAETGEDGVVHEWDDELAGESWPGGPVVLSWEALDDAGSVAAGGANVVIHEFAHKLDMMAGEADGVPPLPSREARALDRGVRRRVRPFLHGRGCGQGNLPRPLRRRARGRVLRGRERGLLRIAERAEAGFPEALRSVLEVL